MTEIADALRVLDTAGGSLDSTPQFEALDRLANALELDGFAWQSWTPFSELMEEQSRLATASFEDAKRFLLCLVRGERFTDGLMAEAARSGALSAVVRRLEVLRTTL